MESLKNQSLFHTKCFINGEWCDADSGEVITVTNPADDSVLGTVPRCGATETRRAIDAAEKAWEGWRNMALQDRCRIVMEWHDLIEANKEDIARLITLEEGKSLVDAVGEVNQNNAHVQWCVEEARRLYGETIPSVIPHARPITWFQPIGIVFAVTPWNLPMGMILRKAGPALAVGCPIIIKPASATPYSGLALAELAKEAGIPNGVFNVITGSAQSIVKEVSDDFRVRKITFTGSTEVGKKLMEESARTVKRTSMELGGNAPAVVFEDADLDAAVDCIMTIKFRHTGQACIAANRIMVQRSVYDEFIRKFIDRVRKLVVGNGLTEGTDIGPVINHHAVEFLSALVQDALEKGAKVVCGGKPHSLGGCFFEPTVVTGVTRDMRMFQEEIFGPVAGITPFDTEEEALFLANDTRYGLAGYVYTRDLARTFRMMEGMQYGMIGVNERVLSIAEIPFGGIKESGLGREGGRAALKEFVDVRYAMIGGLNR
ncbi:NAD-dependent succinate-semialdehyde dehydrogenase [uncultured Mailhella sp.]|uniref:NAD-dependent succinate-semialdehyde dehydrogenase n=1 Tax=uncultured Mailhella sp. TaxID=1981031 RepID=UPI002619D01E|nr:NAD-dependent succinate-semialdehyde dehydrogenase [uncultured Mailhella sp.]